LILGEAAISEKARLPALVAQVHRQLTGKLALPQGTQLLAPVDIGFIQRPLDIGTWQTTLSQLFADTQRAITSLAATGNETLQIAGFRQQTFCDQAIQR